MNKPSGKYILAIASVLALTIGFCGASSNSRISVKELRNTPQSKRLRLERNLDAYLKLSEAEKLRYWEMHRQIQDHNLNPLMKDYEKWLRTISPFDRQLLRTTTEPAAKITEVEKILKSQRKSREHRLPELIARIIEQKNNNLRNSPNGPLHNLLSNHLEFDFKDQYVFSKSQLEALFEILLSQLNTSRREKLTRENPQGIERMFKILRESLAQTVNPHNNWPSQATYTELENEGVSLSFDEADDEKLFHGRLIPRERQENRRRIAFRKTLIRSLMVYEMQQFDEQFHPSEKDLLNFFKLSDSSTQHALLNSPADYQAEALKWAYIWETYHDKSVFSRPEVRKNILQMMAPHLNGAKHGRGGKRPATIRERFHSIDKNRKDPPRPKSLPNATQPDQPKAD